MIDNTRPISVLIADDNVENLRLIESTLHEFGYAVRVATNGAEALESALKEPPDMVLLDVHMPMMDGYEACRRLKQEPATKNIPVLFVSAMGDEFNRLQAFEAGAQDYLTKPVSVPELAARVKVHFSLAQQQEKLRKQAEELKVFNDSMIDREMRVIELKREINALNKKFGQAEPYEIGE